MQLQEYTEEELQKFAEEKSNFYLEAGGCVTFNCLTGGSAVLIIVLLATTAAVVIYAKFFRGSITKLISKAKNLRK